MVSARQNELLTRVEHGAPMGRFMRDCHWIPCALSASLVADGPPQLVRLLGESYVAFRATDGRVGLLDEACPHRRVSLLLARNEDCGLRCIFHAWKIDVSGKVVDVPAEGERSADFASRIKVNHYPTFEGGGLLWVFLGAGAPPPRPPLPFIDIADENIFITRSIAPCNWLQGVEGTIDSVHVGTLHKSWIAQPSMAQGTIGHSLASHPRYEVETTDYGLRASALRDLPDGRQYIRTTEYLMPFVSLVPSTCGSREGTMFIAVPMDDVSHMLFWGLWDEDNPVERSPTRLCAEERDLNNYAMLNGNQSNVWRQDRAAMERGHFTGFDKCLLDEDMVVQASMGAIADRTKEQLCASDIGVMRTRARLLDAISAFEEGTFAHSPARMVRPLDLVTDAEIDWRELAGTNEEPAAAAPVQALAESGSRCD